MSRQALEAPRAQPPRYGLVAAAEVLDNVREARWEGGWKFSPEGCGAGSGRVAAGCNGDTDALDPAANPAVVEGDPFVVWAGDECSTFGFVARDYAGRARRLLESSQSWEIANELWTGDTTVGMADPENRALTDAGSDTVTNGATSPTGALAMAVDALGECGKGRRGMIHVTPQLLVHLAAVQAIYREGNVWLAPMGHVVVADDGYTGSGPGDVAASESQWLYATSMVRLLLGAIEIIPGSFDDAAARARAMNRRTNTVTIYAQRLAGYQWDECCHIAAEVDLARPLIGGAS